ncbi:MAG: hypothetical protein A3J74_00105, partial [Elusimicrobia bacterium RIFCSPHIGHO2_02_FULL_57_9]
MPPDILLLTEEDFPEENRYFAMINLLGAVRRRVRLPHYIHLNITLLASVLQREGFSCELADNFLRLPPATQRFERLLKQAPPVVGLATTFLFREETLRDITRRIRDLSPHSIIILGGPSILQFPEWRRYGDISVLYDGERTLPAVLKTIKSGGNLRDIPGIEFQKDGHKVATEPSEFTPLSELPLPDWSHLGHGRHGVYPIETQRGCVYKCKYCTYPVYQSGDSGTQLHPIPRIIDELRHNYENWGITYYRFIDATFTFPRKRAEDICREIIRSKLPIQWSCFGRVDNMTPELANLMAQAGCRCIFFGIESGDDSMLKRMRKDFRVEHIHGGVQCTHEAGMATVGSFFVGFPGETEETLANTEKIIIDSHFTFLSVGSYWVDPNAPASLQNEEYGLTGRGGQWKHNTMDSTQAEALTGRLLSNVLSKNAAHLGFDFTIASLVNLGLDYDEAMRYMMDKGLLINYRLAKTSGHSLDHFNPKEVERAWSNYQRATLKIAALGRPYYTQ